jgi:hypothetical protein
MNLVVKYLGMVVKWSVSDVRMPEGIRKKPIPDPGSKGSKRHRIPDPDPQH